MENDAIKKALDYNIKLYSLPQTLSEVLKIVADENSNSDDLAKVLLKDPAMTTRGNDDCFRMKNMHLTG